MKKQTDKVLNRLCRLLAKKDVDWAAVEQTIRRFPDINEYDGDDTTLSEAIHYCGMDRGQSITKLIHLFVENGYDLAANSGENGAEVLNALCWSAYDEGVTDAARLLLDMGIDPKLVYRENGQIDHESGIYGTIDWKLIGLWNQGYYDTANIFETLRQIVDAYRDGKDYHRVRCFSDCCGHTLRKVEYLPDFETWGTLAETYPGYDGSLVFRFDDLPLIVRRNIELSVNPFSVEDAKEPLTDVSARFSRTIGARLEKFVFIDAQTVKMCFQNGMILLMTAERINDNLMLSFCESFPEQPFPNLTGMEIDKVVFLSGRVYDPDCTQYTEESLGLLCGDRAFLLWSETDGWDYDDHWFGCLECSREMLSVRRRVLDLPKMKVERMFQHNHRKTGMRLSCGGKYLYLATNYFHEITVSLTGEKINSHEALFAFNGSEHIPTFSV